MSAAQLHALAAGQTLSRASAPTIKPSNAKVGLYQTQLQVVVNDTVSRYFDGKTMSVKFNHTLYPGKLVVEVFPDPKAEARFTRFMTGMSRLSISPTRIEGCGSTFPMFGMTPPDSVVLGRDGILRITLPHKRPPVAPRRTKMVKTKPKARKDPRVVEATEKKEAPATPPKQPLAPAPDRETMRERDTIVAYTKSGVRMVVGRQLAQHMEGGRYGITSFVSSVDEEHEGHGEVVITFMRGRGGNSLGCGGKNKKPGFRQIVVNEIKGKKGRHAYFGPTVAAEVVSVNEGQSIIVTMKPPYLEVGSKKLGSKRRASPTRTAPEANNLSVMSPIARLKVLRDQINECVAAAKRDGDDLRLTVKEDGTLGFIYEA